MTTTHKATIVLRFNNAQKTHDRSVEGHLSPKRIMAYGRQFDRANGKSMSRGGGMTTVRVVSYQEPGKELVVLP